MTSLQSTYFSLRSTLGATLVLLALGCSDGGTGGGGKCVDPAQPVSAQCCLSHGIDACGAQLTCAQLDGRSIPVCYANMSRLAGESCTADALCAGGICDAATGTCGQLVGLPCTPGQSCSDPTGVFAVAACVDQGPPLGFTCEGGDVLGGPCGLCATTEECATPGFTCVDGTCKGGANANVPKSDGKCCLSGIVGGTAQPVCQ